MASITMTATPIPTPIAIRTFGLDESLTLLNSLVAPVDAVGLLVDNDGRLDSCDFSDAKVVLRDPPRPTISVIVVADCARELVEV